MLPNGKANNIAACAATCAAGDVLLHTVTDAILGALSLPDIGEWGVRLPGISKWGAGLNVTRDSTHNIQHTIWEGRSLLQCRRAEGQKGRRAEAKPLGHTVVGVGGDSLTPHRQQSGRACVQP
jgi:hypothetical protein